MHLSAVRGLGKKKENPHETADSCVDPVRRNEHEERQGMFGLARAVPRCSRKPPAPEKVAGPQEDSRDDQQAGSPDAR